MPHVQRGPCTDFEPLIPPVPIVQSAVEPATTQIFVGRAYDMTTPQLVSLFEGVGRVVDAFIMTDSAGRSKGCGIVEFSEPEAAARAIADRIHDRSQEKRSGYPARARC